MRHSTVYLLLVIVYVCLTVALVTANVAQHNVIYTVGEIDGNGYWECLLMADPHYEGNLQPLHVDGKYVKNEDNNIVLLRGWNLMSGTETQTFKLPTWEYYDQDVVDLILTKMASEGATCVRLHLLEYSWMHDISCNTAEGAMSYIDVLHDFMERADDAGLYVVLAFAAVGQYIPEEYGDQMGYDPYTNEFNAGKVTSSSQYTSLVAHIVTELGEYDNLIIEPFNEPWSWYTDENHSICLLWQSIWNEAISKIRSNESSLGYNTHLILCQLGASLRYWLMTDNSSNFNWLESYPLTDSESCLAYSHHVYRAWGSVGGTPPNFDDAPTSYSAIKSIYVTEGVDDATAHSPVVFGEIGAEDDSNELTWLENTLTILNEWESGYLGWDWRDDDGYMHMIDYGTMQTTGGTLNDYGQALADAIADGRPSVVTPTFNPVAGVYGAAQNVAISCATGATIYYTTDGDDPTEEDDEYTDPVNIAVDTTLKALGVLEGYENSSIAAGSYDINLPPPVASPIAVISGLHMRLRR